MLYDDDKNLYSGIDDKIDNKIKEMVTKIKLPDITNIHISEPNLVKYLCDINNKYYMILLMITNIITPTNSEIFNVINNLIKESSYYLTNKMKIIENIRWPEQFKYKGKHNYSSYSWYCIYMINTNIVFNINLSSISYSNYFTLIKTFYKTYFYILENYKLTTYDNLHELIKIWYINNSIFSILHHMFEIHVSKTSYEYIFKKYNTNYCPPRNTNDEDEISSIVSLSNLINKSNTQNNEEYNGNISFNLMDRLSIYLKNLILIDANFEYAFMINNDTKNKNIVLNTVINYNKNIISPEVIKSRYK